MLRRKPAPQIEQLRQLIRDLEEVSPAQVHKVTQARSSSEQRGRVAASCRALAKARATSRDSVYQAAREAKERALKAGRDAGLDGWYFSYAAFEAAIAIGVCDILKHEDYQGLVAPMAVAIPWLLPADQSGGLGNP